MTFLHRALRMAAALVALASCTASWGFGTASHVILIDEYLNDATGHFALVGTDGSLGAGWHRTGFFFEGYVDGILGGVPVCHFRAPSIDGHFYTANTEECEILKHAPGWVYQGISFYALPLRNGACSAGLVGVNELYNHGEASGNPSHRFVTAAPVRDWMVSQGWTDFGPAFCTTGAGMSPDYHTGIYGNGLVGTASGCPSNTRECTVVDNVPPLVYTVPRFVPPRYSDPNPGFPTATDAIVGSAIGDLLTAEPAGFTVSQHTFLTASGVFLNGTDRLAGDYATITQTVQMALAQANETPIYPWRDSPSRSVVVRADFTVPTIVRNDATAHAYGHPMMRWVDAKSGHTFLMTLQAFGTLAPDDFTGRHAITGETIVSTAFGPHPGFGTVEAGNYRHCTGSPCKTDRDVFVFRLHHDDMVEALARARRIDASLSADPADYAISQFMWHDETFRDAQLGMTLFAALLEIWP